MNNVCMYYVLPNCEIFTLSSLVPLFVIVTAVAKTVDWSERARFSVF